MKAALHASLAIVLAAASSLSLSRSVAAGSPRLCSVNPVEVPRRPVRFEGTVVGVVSPERVKVITEKVEKETGARISPDYANLPRIVAKVVTDRRTFETIAAVVDGSIPQPGEHVGLLSRYSDPRSQCDFIPVTASAPAAIS